MILSLLACTLQGPVQQGARAVEQNKLDEAIAAWSIEEGGRASGILSYNLGIAWYRKGDLPRAVASLRAAAMLRPRDANVHHNLALARSGLGIVPTPVPDTGWTQVITAGEMSALGALLAAIGSLGAVLSGLSGLRARASSADNSARITVSPLWPLTLALGVALGLLGLGEMQRQERHPVAVVVDGEAPVRDAADINAGERFRWSVGTETRVQRTLDGWLLAEDSRGRRGWISPSAVVLAR